MRAGLAASTVTPGRTAPDVSRMTPVMTPVWAEARAGSNARPARSIRTRTFERINTSGGRFRVSCHDRGGDRHALLRPSCPFAIQKFITSLGDSEMSDGVAAPEMMTARIPVCPCAQRWATGSRSAILVIFDTLCPARGAAPACVSPFPTGAPCPHPPRIVRPRRFSTSKSRTPASSSPRSGKAWRKRSAARICGFPKEIILLGGAPGAGKGTQTQFIMRARGLTCPPIVISDLLTTPEMERIKAQGGMVGDKEVREPRCCASCSTRPIATAWCSTAFRARRCRSSV